TARDGRAEVLRPRCGVASFRAPGRAAAPGARRRHRARGRCAGLQAMIRDHARALEMASEQCAERAIDAGLTADLGLFQQLKAAVERELLRLVGAQIHSVPSTSTRPAVVTRVCTLLRAGRW